MRSFSGETEQQQLAFEEALSFIRYRPLVRWNQLNVQRAGSYFDENEFESGGFAFPNWH